MLLRDIVLVVGILLYMVVADVVFMNRSTREKEKRGVKQIRIFSVFGDLSMVQSSCVSFRFKSHRGKLVTHGELGKDEGSIGGKKLGVKQTENPGGDNCSSPHLNPRRNNQL